MRREAQEISNPGGLDSESRLKTLGDSGETEQSTNPDSPTELKDFPYPPKDMINVSGNVQHSLGNEDSPGLDSLTAYVKTPSTATNINKENDETQQKDSIPIFGKRFNAQLLEDHYQRFMRGCNDGGEARDGDDVSSRSSSSGQGLLGEESLASDINSSISNGKRRFDNNPGGEGNNSEDDGKANRKRVQKRQKTADEKQTELRCTEFAAGRQTTAKCLTYSTRNLHRLKSVRAFQSIWGLKPSQIISRQRLMSYRITLLQITKLPSPTWTLDAGSRVKPKHCCGSGSL